MISLKLDPSSVWFEGKHFPGKIKLNSGFKRQIFPKPIQKTAPIFPKIFLSFALQTLNNEKPENSKF